MKRDYQTHVFTSTYTADVSGVCSAMYELGGMTVLHDPSGCNSTYSTHDEPRWFDTDSLMYVSGLDEVTAVMGDDSVLIRDVVQAANDLKPAFITLCGASIPHIIAFDYRGVAHLIEEECGIPVLPVPTDGLRSYVSGAGMAFTAWLERFADPEEYTQARAHTVNLLGVTPLDFSINNNVKALRETMEAEGFRVNCCMAMGDTFGQLQHAYRAELNVVVSSAGRHTAKYMKKKAGIPYVEGLPIGKDQCQDLMACMQQSRSDGKPRYAFEELQIKNRFETPSDCILVIGEEIFSRSLANALNHLPQEQRKGKKAVPLWPDIDEGMPEEELIRAVQKADTVIADPLYQVILRKDSNVRFIPFPHEAYSGRIFRSQIPVFADREFSAEKLLQYEDVTNL